MIVLDASALLELLLGTERGREVRARIADPAVSLHIPHLADIEVAQALRRYVREGELNLAAADEALESLCALDLERHPHEPLLWGVWELRENLTACDAVYLALAEVLGAVVLTCDRRLARAPAAAGRLELVG